jgi:hypothetical protein
MALDTQNTSSIEVEIDLQQVLSLVGIDLPNTGSLPPTGSLPEPPKKIKLQSIKGTVVDLITNQPLPGVVVTNKLLKRDTTNSKGEFSIKHPDLTDTGFDPAKFPLNFKLRNYGPYTTTPYKSDGTLKPDLGIITLDPLQSNLQKEIQKLFKFPDSVVEEYNTKDVTVDFRVQKKLNVSIDTLKGIVVPLLLTLIAAYGISKVEDLIKKYEIDPQAALDEIKDLITCPTQAEMDRLIATKNKLVKKINNTLTVINKTTETLAKSQQIINIAQITLPPTEVLLNTTPTSIAGVPILFGVISGLQKLITFLNQNIDKFSYINSTTLAILTLLRGVLVQVLSLLKILDLLTQYCYPNAAQERISTELTALTSQQSTQLSPVVTNVNGFEMGVETENTTNTLKRRRAIARNKQGVVMLKGEYSFSSIDQILIDELVFYIQQNDLKAD